MRRTRRSLTLLLKVTALMSAVAWTAARHELATAGTVTVLVALSILSLRPRPRLWRSRAAVIERARHRCEYCGLAQAGQEAMFHI